MKKTFALLALLALVPFALVGCSSEDDALESDPQVLEQAGGLSMESLGAMDGVDMVDYLDRLPKADRPQTIIASVRANEVLLADAESGDEKLVDLPDDQFYLSFAPYVSQTHDCFYHSLTTCVGEIQNEDVDVQIVSSDGEVLVDETMTTYDNGFVGVWLPADIEATLTVEYDGKTGTAEIATGEQDPTCLTTLQVS